MERENLKNKEEKERRKRQKKIMRRKYKAQRRANKRPKGYYFKLFFGLDNLKNSFKDFIFLVAIGEVISSLFKNFNRKIGSHKKEYCHEEHFLNMQEEHFLNMQEEHSLDIYKRKKILRLIITGIIFFILDFICYKCNYLLGFFICSIGIIVTIVFIVNKFLD